MRGTHTRWSMFVFNLAFVFSAGSPHLARAADSCLETAFALMTGTFTATGRKLGESGELVPFVEHFKVISESPTTISFYADDMKYGTWKYAADDYRLFTFQPGSEVEDDEGIPVTYQCDANETKSIITLSERWFTPKDATGKEWLVRQSRRLSADRMVVSTTVQEAGTSFPPIVVSTFHALPVIVSEDAAQQ